MLDELYAPDGYNIGTNCGEAADQTINRCHIHITSRFKGDVTDPVGGGRGVIPDKRSYLSFKGSGETVLNGSKF